MKKRKVKAKFVIQFICTKEPFSTNIISVSSTATTEEKMSNNNNNRSPYGDKRKNVSLQKQPQQVAPLIVAVVDIMFQILSQDMNLNILIYIKTN